MKIIAKRFKFGMLATGLAVCLQATLRAESSLMDNHNMFATMHLGYSFPYKADYSISGPGSSFGYNTNDTTAVNLNDLSVKKSISGGLGVGYWFKQRPVSLGASFTMDFQDASYPETTQTNVPFTQGGRPGTFASYTKFQSSIMEWHNSFNVIVGAPIGSARLYAGLGPDVAVLFYSSKLKDSNGNDAGDLTDTQAKIGLNSFAGIEYYVNQRWSLFLEGRYVRLKDVSFKPTKSDDSSTYGNTTYTFSGTGYNPNTTDKYSNLDSASVRLGAAIHF